MIPSIRHALARRPSNWFIVLCLALLIGGLIAGTLLLFTTIEPLPALPLPQPEQIA